MQKPIAIPPDELSLCGGQLIAKRHGIQIPDEEHFYTSIFERSLDPFKTLAEAALNTAGIQCDRSNRQVILQRAMTSSVFEDVLAQAGRIAAVTRANSAIADIRQLATVIELSDFKECKFPLIESEPITDTQEGGNIEALLVRSTGESIAVEESVKNLLFSRQALINDDGGILIAGIQAVAAAAGRKLATKFVALLEDNNNLADGSNWFDATAGNALTSAAGVSATTLNDSAEALRTMQTPDNENTNAKPKFLIVPTSQEMAAKIVVGSVNEALPESEHMRVVVLPDMGSSYWYLCGDPDESPAVALATLEGGDIITTERMPEPRFREAGGTTRDASGFRVRWQTGLSPVSRSIIRNTLA